MQVKELLSQINGYELGVASAIKWFASTITLAFPRLQQN